MKRFQFISCMAVAGLLLMSRSEATILDNFADGDSTGATFSYTGGLSYDGGSGNPGPYEEGGLTVADTLGGVREMTVVKTNQGSMNVRIDHSSAPGHLVVDGDPHIQTVTTLTWDGVVGNGGSAVLDFDQTANAENGLNIDFTQLNNAVTVVFEVQDGSAGSVSTSYDVTAGAKLHSHSLDTLLAAGLDNADWDRLILTITAPSGTEFHVDSIEIGDHIAAVPEPSSVVLMSLGLVGLIGYRRRCRKKADVA